MFTLIFLIFAVLLGAGVVPFAPSWVALLAFLASLSAVEAARS